MHPDRAEAEQPHEGRQMRHGRADRSFRLYRMPPASSRGLRSYEPSRRQIILQLWTIFKSLHLSRSAFVSHVAEHFDLRDTRTVKACVRCLFLALLLALRDILHCRKDLVAMGAKQT